MYIIDEKEFDLILKDKFKALVGVSCKRIELIRGYMSISSNVKYDLIKNLIKELDWEAKRELQVQVRCFSKGLNYFKVNMTPPLTKN